MSALVSITVMLVAASVVARLTLELPEATPAWRRAAARALAPLSTATLAALAVCAVARVLDGGLSGLGVALLLMVAAGIVLLRVAVPEAAPAATPRATPEPTVVQPRAPRPAAAAPLRPTDGALWAGRRDGDAADRRSGLWRQA